MEKHPVTADGEVLDYDLGKKALGQNFNSALFNW
jgi:hypothetical protein